MIRTFCILGKLLRSGCSPLLCPERNFLRFSRRFLIRCPSKLYRVREDAPGIKCRLSRTRRILSRSDCRNCHRFVRRKATLVHGDRSRKRREISKSPERRRPGEMGKMGGSFKAAGSRGASAARRTWLRGMRTRLTISIATHVDVSGAINKARARPTERRDSSLWRGWKSRSHGIETANSFFFYSLLPENAKTQTRHVDGAAVPT